MAKKLRLNSGETIVVSKWLQELWDVEEKHPFLVGSRLSSKSWVPASPKKRRKTVTRKVAGKRQTSARG
jgi:hypothetical protein